MRILISNGHNRLTGVTTFNYAVGKKLKILGHQVDFYIHRIETHFDHVQTGFNEIGNVFISTQLPSNDFDAIFFCDPFSQTILNAYKGKKYFFIHGLSEPNLWPNEILITQLNHVFALSPFMLGTVKGKFPKVSCSYVPNLIDTQKFQQRLEAPKKLSQVLIHDRRNGQNYIDQIKKIGSILKFQGSLINDYNFGYPIWDIEKTISTFDLVLAYGRSALEAISTGTPVFIFGKNGGDGIITEDNFERSFQRNCSGYGIHKFKPSDPNVWIQVIEEIAKYKTNAGPKLRSLAIEHFDLHSKIGLITQYL